MLVIASTMASRACIANVGEIRRSLGLAGESFINYARSPGPICHRRSVSRRPVVPAGCASAGTFRYPAELHGAHSFRSHDELP